MKIVARSSWHENRARLRKNRAIVHENSARKSCAIIVHDANRGPDQSYSHFLCFKNSTAIFRLKNSTATNVFLSERFKNSTATLIFHLKNSTATPKCHFKNSTATSKCRFKNSTATSKCRLKNSTATQNSINKGWGPQLGSVSNKRWDQFIIRVRIIS